MSLPIKHSQFWGRVILSIHTDRKTCLDEEKEEKVWEKEALSVTGRFFVTISRVLPSPLFVVLPAEVV